MNTKDKKAERYSYFNNTENAAKDYPLGSHTPLLHD